MARIWVEAFDENKHVAPWEYHGRVNHHCRAPKLIPKNVLLVNVASFTFQFFTIQQLLDCLDFYERKIRPSSALDIGAASNWEVQRWFDRLPMYLLEEPKRTKVVKALAQARKVGQRHLF